MADQDPKTMTPNFISERHLKNLDGDLLGWSRVVDQVEAAIRRSFEVGGFAVGIKGSWGAGKSTMLDAIDRRFANESSVLIFKYNPWLYPREDHVRMFFGELAKFVRKKDQSPVAKKLADRLDAVAAFSRNAGEAIRRLAVIVRSVSGLFVAAGLTAVISGNGSKWLVVVLLSLGVIGELLSLTESTLKYVTGLFRRPLNSLETLGDLKGEIDALLTKLGTHLVVIIDDLDRLPPGEICQIFQIVKNNGDLGNATYVISFDDEIVKEVLKREYGGRYEGFSEKIIQLDFNVPVPESVILDDYFRDHVEAILVTMPEGTRQRWNEERWSVLFYRFFRHTYRTFRDIKRILNGFVLTLPLVGKNGILEVDPLDFLALETMRIRFPIFYDFIRRNKPVFVHVPPPNDYFGLSEEPAEQLLAMYESALEQISDTNERRAVDQACKNLFLQLSSPVRDQRFVVADNTDLTAGCRVAASDTFDRYFIYGNLVNDIPNALIQETVRNLHEHEQSVTRLLDALDYNRFLVAVERVIGVAMADNPQSAEAYDALSFLMCAAERFPPPQRSMTDTTHSWLLFELTSQIVEHIPPEHRENVLISAIGSGSSVFGPLCLLKEADRIQKEPQYANEKMFSDAERRKLRLAMTDRGMKFLSQRDCLSHPNLLTILKILMYNVAAMQVSRHLDLLIRDDPDFMTFLTHFLVTTETVTSGLPHSRVTYRFDYDSLSELLDFAEISARIYRTPIPADTPGISKLVLSTFKNGLEEYLQKRGGSEPIN